MKNALILFLTILVISSCEAKKDYLVTIHTSLGDMKLVLFDATPKHKDNFIKLAREGAYDGTTFHRVIADFMIQGGDVNAKPDVQEKIEYTIPAELVDTLFHRKGAVCAARQGDNINPQKRSSGSQFYIVEGAVYSKDALTLNMQQAQRYVRELSNVPGYQNILYELDSLYRNAGMNAVTNKIIELKPVMEERFDIELDQEYPQDRLAVYSSAGGTPHLDDAYTVFGQLVEGFDVLDKISKVETNTKNRADKPDSPPDTPIEDITITVEVKEISPKKAQKLYFKAIQ